MEGGGRERIRIAQQKWVTQHNRYHFERRLTVVDLVFLRTPAVSTGMSTKLQPKYRGPLLVSAAKPAD
jgi:hypothetical protein